MLASGVGRNGSTNAISSSRVTCSSNGSCNSDSSGILGGPSAPGTVIGWQQALRPEYCHGLKLCPPARLGHSLVLAPGVGSSGSIKGGSSFSSSSGSSSFVVVLVLLVVILVVIKL